MSVTAVTVDGTPLDLAQISYNLKVTHGRSDIQSSPQPGQCVFTYQLPDDSETLPINLADSINVKALSIDRFTGQVTDIAVTHLASTPPTTFIEITAMGPLARLSRFTAGGSGYAADSVQNRVDAILTGTGLAYTAEADPLLNLNAYAANETNVQALLQEICEWTGATLFDTPGGQIYFESYTRRGYSYSTARWDGYVTETFADIVGAWDEQFTPGTSAPQTVTIPGSAIVWEPTWSTADSTIINEVQVTYGTASPQATVTYQDTNSISTYDKRATQITTQLALEADAQRRAQLVLTSQASERYSLGEIQVLMDALDAGTRTNVLNMQEGARVLIQDLPLPNPTGTSQFLGVLEGWSELHEDGLWTLGISLSDPRFSYAVISWAEAPATATWGGVPNTVTWSDVILPSDLT